MPDNSRLLKKAALNTKTTEIENKITNITGLVTTTALDTKAT